MKPYSSKQRMAALRGKPRPAGQSWLLQAIGMMLTLLVVVRVEVARAATLYASVLTAEPSEVLRRDVKLSLLVEPTPAIPAGAHVELRLPPGGDVSFTAAALATAPACDLLGLAVPEVLSCEIEERGGTQ